MQWVRVFEGRKQQEVLVLADVKTHDSDGIVEERLAEDDDVEDFVDVDLFEDGDDGHGVDGGDQGRKQKRLQESWKKINPLKWAFQIDAKHLFSFYIEGLLLSLGSLKLVLAWRLWSQSQKLEYSSFNGTRKLKAKISKLWT